MFTSNAFQAKKDVNIQTNTKNMVLKKIPQKGEILIIIKVMKNVTTNHFQHQQITKFGSRIL